MGVGGLRLLAEPRVRLNLHARCVKARSMKPCCQWALSVREGQEASGGGALCRGVLVFHDVGPGELGL